MKQRGFQGLIAGVQAELKKKEEADEQCAYMDRSLKSPSVVGEDLDQNTLHPRPRTLASSYYLCSANAMRHISPRRKNEYIRLMPRQWKEDPGVNIKEVIWREDMGDYVLGVFRKKMGKYLEILAKKHAEDLVPCSAWGGVGKVGHVQAVLWLSGDGIGDEGVLNVNKEAPVGNGLEATVQKGGLEAVEQREPSMGNGHAGSADGPPPYAMVRYDGGHIPVYNLRKLFGQDLIGELRNKTSPGLDRGLIMVKMARATTVFQQGLWQLMGYLSNKGQWAQ